MRTDPKPTRRIVDPKVGLETIAKGRQCAVEGCTKPAATRHHVVPKSLGGDDHVDNIFGVCGSGTTEHHGLLEKRDPDTCRRLRAAMPPEVIRYVIVAKSKVFLDLYYPPS